MKQCQFLTSALDSPVLSVELLLLPMCPNTIHNTLVTLLEGHVSKKN